MKNDIFNDSEFKLSYKYWYIFDNPFINQISVAQHMFNTPIFGFNTNVTGIVNSLKAIRIIK